MAVTDRVVQYANRYKITNVSTGEELGIFDFEEVPGTVTTEGTEINAALFDNVYGRNETVISSGTLDDSMSLDTDYTINLNTALGLGSASYDYLAVSLYVYSNSGKIFNLSYSIPQSVVRQTTGTTSGYFCPPQTITISERDDDGNVTFFIGNLEISQSTGDASTATIKINSVLYSGDILSNAIIYVLTFNFVKKSV